MFSAFWAILLPDPLRNSDPDQPNIGAVPWRIGVDGRMSLFGTRSPGNGRRL
jgi:hypothetical protein